MWKGSSTIISRRVGDRDGIWLSAWVLSISDRTVGRDISAHSLGDVFCLSQRITDPYQDLRNQLHSPTCNVLLCSIELNKNMSLHVFHCCHTWLQALRNKSAAPLQRQILNHGVSHHVLEIKILKSWKEVLSLSVCHCKLPPISPPGTHKGCCLSGSFCKRCLEMHR